MSDSHTREMRIINKLGLHARAAAKFVTTASSFESEITVRRNSKEVNGKSIMGVMMLAAEQGSTVTIRAVGTDASGAVDALAALVADGFGEEEAMYAEGTAADETD